jgi:hypothetical protein
MTRSRDTASIIPTVDAKGDLLVGTADNTIDNLSLGTNGQVLTANSATATGLEWVNNVISSATPPSNTSAIWFNTENGTAYVYYDGFWTSVAGNSGSPIISDTAPTSPVVGMQWFNSSNGKSYLYYSNAWVEIDSNGTATASTGNAIINGAFEINQRGFTSTTSSSVYTFDRWQTFVSGNGTSTYTAQSFSPGELATGELNGISFIRVQTTGQTAGDSGTQIRQSIEDVRSFAGSAVTISFYAKSASGSPKVAIELVQGFGTGGSASVTNYTGQITLSSSWQRHSVTFLLPSVSGKTIGSSSSLRLALFVSAGTDLNSRTGSLGIQSNTFDIWGVQLEAGTVATPFKRNAPSIQAELAACQRYYEKSYNLATALGANDPGSAVTFYGSSDASSNIVTRVPFAVQKRTSSYTLNVWGPTGTANVITYNRSGAAANGTAIPYRFSQNAFHVYTGIGAGFVAATAEFHFAVSDEL